MFILCAKTKKTNQKYYESIQKQRIFNNRNQLEFFRNCKKLIVKTRLKKRLHDNNLTIYRNFLNNIKSKILSKVGKPSEKLIAYRKQLYYKQFFNLTRDLLHQLELKIKRKTKLFWIKKKSNERLIKKFTDCIHYRLHIEALALKYIIASSKINYKCFLDKVKQKRKKNDFVASIKRKFMFNQFGVVLKKFKRIKTINQNLFEWNMNKSNKYKQMSIIKLMKRIKTKKIRAELNTKIFQIKLINIVKKESGLFFKQINSIINQKDHSRRIKTLHRKNALLELIKMIKFIKQENINILRRKKKIFKALKESYLLNQDVKRYLAEAETHNLQKSI